ncbi:hypothetical protein ACH41H_37420 [Streptomyces sp. NPDC020800]|uniref:hypothetical protein n=1 Tax=Streptomyces sp. NPDC020800 TaxID=3365092 RepID=UPI0037A678D5
MTETLAAVYPPADDDGRRVRVGDRFTGSAQSLLDIAVFLRRAGVHDIEPDDVERAIWVE